MKKSSAKSELTAGIFVLIGLCLFCLLVIKFGDFKRWNKSKYRLTVRFEDVSNLIKEAPVRRGGVEIGWVDKDPTLEQGSGVSGVMVPLTIYSEYHIPEGSLFHIKADGLMGDSFVDIVSPKGPTGVMLKDGAVLAGTMGGDLSASATMVADNAKLVMQDLQLTLKDIRTAMDKLVSTENTQHISTTLGSLESSMGKLDNKVLNEKNVTELGATLENLRTSAERFGNAAEKAEKLLVTADQSITTKLNPGLDEFNKAMVSFRKTAESLGLLTTSTGLIPALVKDPKIKEDFAALVSNLRRHGVVFGYKDDFDAVQKEAAAPKQEKRGFFGR